MTHAPIAGVRTTGIYCRNGCSATPRQRNVVRFENSVAAEAAGFRPCLRCRPDRLPPLASLAEAAPVVERALLRINEGALDHAREEDLARELAISGRQLRRLFLQHIGATPAFVARSRRAHFARRLLDETDLSVTRIAYAAGFTSVRQMNRVMLDTFKLTPSELRKRRFKGDRLVADGGLRLRLPYRCPLAFGAMLDYLAPRAIPGVESVFDRSYRRTITTCGNPGVIELQDAGDARHLLMTAHLPTFDALIDDVSRVRRIFALDIDPACWLPRLASDPLLAPLLATSPGLRPPGAWDPFEVAVRIILGQGISVAAASTLAGRLARDLGSAVPGLQNLELTHTFPTARRLAEASLDALTSLGLPTGRAEAVRALARRYAGGTLALHSGRPLGELVDALSSLPGVGPWTAHLVALRAAGHLDAFPAEDLGLRRAASLLSGRDVSSRELVSMAEAWRPYRAVAAMHLWASLRHAQTRNRNGSGATGAGADAMEPVRT